MIQAVLSLHSGRLIGDASSFRRDLNVPLPARQEPERLLDERDHIEQLDRCLTDESMPLDLRVGGALVLLFGMLVSRITQLTKNDVIEDSRATWLAIDGHRLMLPTRLAQLVRQLRDQDEPRWTLGRLGTPVPWLFPGQSPTRPAVDILFGVRLHRYGIATPMPVATPPALHWLQSFLPLSWLT